MFMKVLCCIFILACCAILCIQIKLDKLWYDAIYEAEKIRYEGACKEKTMSNFNNKDNAFCGEWIAYGTIDFCCHCDADMRGKER